MAEMDIYVPAVPRSERKLRVRGADYCVHEWGSSDSPLFVYLHGWGDTGSTFQFVVDALARQWRVIAPDWRGFGRSTCRCSSYWFPDYLADLHVLLEQVSPGEPLRLVGHSMGANVAALYAGTFPERVKAFVNIEGFGLIDSSPAGAPSRYRAWIEAANEALSFSEYDDLSVLAERIGKRHPCMSGGQAAYVAKEWSTVDANGKVRLRADPLHKLPNPVLYRRAEAEACWRAATATTLLVIGGESRFATDLHDASGADLFPGDETAVIDEAGHMLHFEVPGPLARTIENFLQNTL
ncbi:MAG: alpha/beta fold hydrolase [Woeseiaceae bacterium]